MTLRTIIRRWEAWVTLGLFALGFWASATDGYAELGEGLLMVLTAGVGRAADTWWLVKSQDLHPRLRGVLAIVCLLGVGLLLGQIYMPIFGVTLLLSLGAGLAIGTNWDSSRHVRLKSRDPKASFGRRPFFIKN